MTRIDKSDAQLDAEANVTLSELIRAHRIYYQRDLYIPRLSTESPPVFIDPQTGKPDEVEASQVGMTLSWPLTSYITDAYGQTFPWSRAAFAQWAMCRRVHPEHADRDEFDGSLCKLLVGLVIRQGYVLERACLKIGITPEKAGRVLRAALLGIDSEMKRQKAKAHHRQMEDEGRFIGQDTEGRYVWDEPPPAHHAVPGMHIEDCPNPACREYRSKAA